MRKLFMWTALLNKRLYCKASFVAILVLIISAVIGFGVLSQNDSGFLNIIIVNQNPKDEISSKITNDLLNEKSMIMFSSVSSPQEAIEKVENGKADAAWIFCGNTEKGVEDFSYGKSDKGVVTVIEREQNIVLRLSHEKLSAKLYRYASKTYYISFVRRKLPILNDLSDNELSAFFDNTDISDELFVFGEADENTKSDKLNYLTAPLKGLLAVIITVGGMAGALYYMQDKRRKTFDTVSESRRFYLAFIGIFVAVINIAAVCFIALLVTDMTGALYIELFSILTFSLSATSFCLLLYSLFPKIYLFASLIPIWAIGMIGICPVFFNFKSLEGLSLLFPVSYYLRSSYDGRYILFSLCFSAVCFLLARLFTKVNKAV